MVDLLVRNYDGDMSEVDRMPSTITDAVLALAGELDEHLVDPDTLAAWTGRFFAEVQSHPGRVYADVRRALQLQRTRLKLLPLVRADARRKDACEAMDFAAPLARAARVARALRAAGDPRLRAAARELLLLAGPWPPPAPPAEEVRRRSGPLHTKTRDRAAISHHYDVGNDFYALVLGPSMVYSCAYWTEDGTLEDAQRDKLELICRKLALRPGGRLLDVGCGWGSLALHAARHHGATVVGITLSAEQAAYARKRVADEGLTDRVEIRVQDYRDVRDGPYDAIASVGMAEHVGAVRYRSYARLLYGLLKPGGRLLNHQIARRPEPREEEYRINPFIDAYVFPDGELAPLGRTTATLEEAGFEVRDVEAIREHYALTLRRWVANLEEHWDEAVRLAGPGRARVWRLYMAASALAFERNRIGVNQVLAVRTPAGGASGMPLRSRIWSENHGS
ncbi:cyclopropane-fatty-acyl-phospholipid synthase family protein [Streptomyces sp. NPDC052644]